MARIFTSGCAVTAGAWLALLGQGPAQAAPCNCEVRVYVDCSAKAKANAKKGNGTKKRPYDSLGDINQRELRPGAVIRLKRGTKCEGTLKVTGSGSAAAPIVIGAYGSAAARPEINADGAAQAVLLEGQHIHLADLELTAPGDGRKPRRGVLVRAKDTGTVRGIVISGLDIHDVRGQAGPAADQDKGQGADASGGIVAEAQGNSTPTSFAGLKIRGNLIHDIDGQGIHGWSNWCRRPDVAVEWQPSACTEAWKPFSRLAIRGNLLWGVGGDGIAVSASQAAVIKRNRLQGFGESDGSLGHGIAAANSEDLSVAGNEVSGGRGTGLAYSIGSPAVHTTLQENLSHNNKGGFLRLCSSGTASVRDFAVRGNISVNDHARGFATCAGPLDDGRIHGNTVVLGPAVSQLIVNAKARGDVEFANNLIARSGSGGTVGWNLGSASWKIDHNLLHGLPVPENAKGTVKADPALLAGGMTDPFGYQLRPGSAALGAGVTTPEPHGYPLAPVHVSPATPNIGAIQAPGAFTGMADTFGATDLGKVPEDWSVKGTVAVIPDPPGFIGRSLALTSEGSAAVRAFPVTGGAVRVNARLRIAKPGGNARVRVTDTDGKAAAEIVVSDSGRLTYSDGSDTKTASFIATPKMWSRISLLLRPEDGRYDIAANEKTIATGALKPGGLAAKLAIEAPSGAVSVDDVLVGPEICTPAQDKHHG